MGFIEKQISVWIDTKYNYRVLTTKWHELKTLKCCLWADTKIPVLHKKTIVKVFNMDIKLDWRLESISLETTTLAQRGHKHDWTVSIFSRLIQVIRATSYQEWEELCHRRPRQRRSLVCWCSGTHPQRCGLLHPCPNPANTERLLLRHYYKWTKTSHFSTEVFLSVPSEKKEEKILRRDFYGERYGMF